MKKLLSIFLMLILTFPAFAATFQGGVAEQGSANSSRIMNITSYDSKKQF